jgi:hypothetical protein
VSYIGVEQLNSHAFANAGMSLFHEPAHISSNALVRIEAKHPFELKMLARNLQQKSAMSSLFNPASLNVRFPRPICDSQGDFWMPAENFQRSIRARVVIGDYGINVPADVVQRVLKNKRLIASAGNPNQKVPTAQ